MDYCTSFRALLGMGGWQHPPLVIDVGSGTFKFGFAGESSPRACFWSAAAVFETAQSSEWEPDMLRWTDPRHVALDFPVVHGVIISVGCLAAILQHVYDEVLCVPPQSQAVCVTMARWQSPLVDDVVYAQTQVNLLSILLNTFNVPYVKIVEVHDAALAAVGLPGGLIVVRNSRFYIMMLTKVFFCACPYTFTIDHFLLLIILYSYSYSYSCSYSYSYLHHTHTHTHTLTLTHTHTLLYFHLFSYLSTQFSFTFSYRMSDLAPLA